MTDLMDAREHYAAAHRWLDTAGDAAGDDRMDFAGFAVANAQVHALLAQAATEDPTLAIEDVAVPAPQYPDRSTEES